MIFLSYYASTPTITLSLLSYVLLPSMLLLDTLYSPVLVLVYDRALESCFSNLGAKKWKKKKIFQFVGDGLAAVTPTMVAMQTCRSICNKL